MIILFLGDNKKEIVRLIVWHLTTIPKKSVILEESPERQLLYTPVVLA